MMLDLAQNSPPKVKIPTPTIYSGQKTKHIHIVYLTKNKRIGPLPF